LTTFAWRRFSRLLVDVSLRDPRTTARELRGGRPCIEPTL